jgi:hypothetical protein
MKDIIDPVLIQKSVTDILNKYIQNDKQVESIVVGRKDQEYITLFEDIDIDSFGNEPFNDHQINIDHIKYTIQKLMEFNNKYPYNTIDNYFKYAVLPTDNIDYMNKWANTDLQNLIKFYYIGTHICADTFNKAYITKTRTDPKVCEQINEIRKRFFHVNTNITDAEMQLMNSVIWDT